jgi:predicted RNA-binding Zn ribbon-like protein
MDQQRDEQLRAGTLKLLAGRLSLDFINTVYWHLDEEPEEFLTGYAELVDWAEHAGILVSEDAAELRTEAAHAPDAARAIRERAVALREALFRTFLAATRRARPEAGDLHLINRELKQALAHLELGPAGRGLAWDWNGSDGALDRMLWPILQDAAQLLTSAELERVKVCGDDRCGWLFLDTSRNRSRRWCSMEDCGNRAKARRYYWRQQTEE